MTVPRAHHGRAASTFVLVTVLLDSIAIGIMLPALPKLIESFVPGDPVWAARLVGLFAAGWGLMQLVGSPVLGALSDRFGRRPVILASNLGLAIDYSLMAFAPSLWLLFAGRLLAGFTTSTFATAYAYVTDVTPEEGRAAAFGRIGAVFGLGFIIGPAVGGLLAEIGPRVPFMLAASLSLLNFGYGYLVLPESLASANRMRFSWFRANPFGSLRLLGRSRRLTGLAVVNLLDQLALVSIPATFVLYTSGQFQWSEATTGITFAAIGAGLACVHAFLTGPVVGRAGGPGTLYIGLSFGVLGFVLYGLAPSSLFIWAAIPFLCLWALADSPIQALMTREVRASEYGQLQGATAALFAVAETIGPLVFSQLYAYAIMDRGDSVPAGAPYLLAAALQVCAIGIAMRVLAKQPTRQQRDSQL